MLYNTLLNLEFSSHTIIIAFGDDFAILTHGKTLFEAEVYANSDLAKIENWAGENKMRFNESKSYFALLAIFELICQCYKICLDRCDDFDLYFCLKVKPLCPPTSLPQLRTSLCCRYNPITPHTPFSTALHILLFLPELSVLNFR